MTDAPKLPVIDAAQLKRATERIEQITGKLRSSQQKTAALMGYLVGVSDGMDTVRAIEIVK